MFSTHHSSGRSPRRALAGAALAFGLFALTACGGGSGDAGAEGSNDDPIRIGTTDANLPEWDAFSDLAEEEGIAIEIVPFSDYNTPNDALVQDQIDVNKFQHLAFLARYNVGAEADIVPIASTEIYPLALFWEGHDSLDGIDGQEVAIPNDETNQGRAINVLVQHDLVTLRTEGILNPTPADIDQDASRVSVTTVDAAQTTVAYSAGTPAVINNSFLERAGISPEDAIVQDDPNNPEAEPYINVWATIPEKADDERIVRLTELWKDQSVIDAVQTSSGGTSVPVQRPRADLEEILARQVEAVRAEG